MPKVTVDGTEIDVPNGATVLQACELLRARPGFDSEQGIVDRLGPVIVANANAQGAELNIPTSLIRRVAADGLWSRSQRGAAS